MKFKGTPGLMLRDYSRKATVGRFDENGIMEVTDGYYIKKMIKRYEAIDDAETKQAEGQAAEAEAPPAEIKYACKKCTAEGKTVGFSNMGELMAHYRKEHPKAGGK